MLSSLAVSRLDLMSACLAAIALTAGRAEISSNQRLKFGLLSMLAHRLQTFTRRRVAPPTRPSQAALLLAAEEIHA